MSELIEEGIALVAILEMEGQPNNAMVVRKLLAALKERESILLQIKQLEVCEETEEYTRGFASCQSQVIDLFEPWHLPTPPEDA